MKSKDKTIEIGALVISSDYGLVKCYGPKREGVGGVVEYYIRDHKEEVDGYNPYNDGFPFGVYAGTIRKMTKWDKFKHCVLKMDYKF